jgi:hypothetical protein
MVSRVVLVCFVAAAIVSAQGGGVPGGGGSGGAANAAALQQFAVKLKLDQKVQIPAVETIFTDAARAAQPLSAQLTQLRRKLFDAEVAGKADEVASAREALTAAAAKMTLIETQAYQRVFDILKPNQQARTAEAFELMAGLFQTTPRPSSRSGRGGGQ